jgi:hypothetical protein
MAATPSPHARVIAGRYLASAAGLAARPAGPVEALDTTSGRAAQVRIVFLPSHWDEEELAEAVARWCGLGCAEVCGILDFGRDESTWFLVLPPTLGIPLERWRMLRRPTSAGAARLTLGFGRLVERVVAAGFAPQAAELRDLSVGPGPTPFLDRPLLGAPGGPGDADAAGQRLLGMVLRAAAGEQVDLGVAAWASRAEAREFASLRACLDELEAVADEAERGAVRLAGDDDLAGLLDESDVDGLLAGPDRLTLMRRAGALLLLLAIIAAGIGLTLGDGTPSAAQAPPPSPPGTIRPLAGESSEHTGRRPLARTSVAKAVIRPKRGQRDPVAKRHTPAEETRAAAPPAQAADPSPAPAPSSTAPTPTRERTGGGGLPSPAGVVTLPPP